MSTTLDDVIETVLRAREDGPDALAAMALSYGARMAPAPRRTTRPARPLCDAGCPWGWGEEMQMGDDVQVVVVACAEDAEEAIESIDAINAWLRTPAGVAAAADALDRGVPLMWPPERTSTGRAA